MLIKNLKNKYSTLTPFKRFFYDSIFFYVVWEFAYQFFFKDQSLDNYLITNAVRWSKYFLSFFQYNVLSDFNLISIEGFRTVLITSECGILPTFGFYTAFIFGYPIKINIKILFIIIGAILLHLFNILRISILTLTMAYCDNLWGIVHRLDSYVIFYPLILFLWYSASTFHEKNFSLSNN